MGDQSEQTLVLCKPDALARGLVGEVVGRIERKGLRIAAMRMLHVDEEMARRHYAEHLDKAFFPELLAFITGGPTVAMIVEGTEAVSVVRTLIGATNPREAAPGTIRGDLAVEVTKNLVHGSDSLESAAREIAIFFPRLDGSGTNS